MALWELLTLLFPYWRIFVFNIFLAGFEWAADRILASYGLGADEENGFYQYDMDSSSFELPSDDNMYSIMATTLVQARNQTRRASLAGEMSMKFDDLDQTFQNFQVGMADVSRVHPRDISFNQSFQNFPPGMADVSRVHPRDISFNQSFQHFPPGMADVSRVHPRDISFNQSFQNFPPGMADASRAHPRDNPQNQSFHNFPGGTADASRVPARDNLHNQSFQNFPAADVPRVQTRDILHNQTLQVFPAGMADISRVHTRDIAHNQTFQSFPVGMADLSRVRARDIPKSPTSFRGRIRPDSRKMHLRGYRSRGSTIRLRPGRRGKESLKRWFDVLMDKDK